ncbi:nuclear transport factor 2 family protein [Altibacter sp. HG106]|uniref:nuclear transport factor 2 family protein n=1 Tax=Altibacter sp. HG106 TaxID=3023937 RepID=UPI002350F5C2|nr:nuclear transport factor 2 family protein [Altibacter sp. HG106]MDC7995416.1 nuclear transport factor 2 family protein [Altibacter sp. HG106]
MKKFLGFLLFLSCFGMTFGQTPTVTSEAIAVVDTFFEGFHKGDTTQMKSVMAETVVFQTAFTDATGTPKLNDGSAAQLLSAIANRPKEQVWEERLLGYEVQTDGNLAHVWTRYEFWLNGTFSYCGANAFTLVKMGSGWKIIHLIDSRRKADCRP